MGGVPFNGGGSGGGIGNAGGGATDIRIGGTALSNRVLVAGGGGGSGSFIGSTGGGGGGLTGGNETGANGTGGGGGTPVHGGAGSAGGVDGTAGTGGAGANGGGGGGGGGYFGGGGGGPANNGNGGGTGGSGGGGSSYSDPVLVTSVVHTQGANNGNGTITISWSTAPACALSVSISPASQTITSGGSATLTASGATSYIWSNGFTANPLILTNVTSTSTISVTGTTGSCSATATVTLTVNAPVCGAGLSGPTWTGCVSRDWNTAGNWASGTVPTATDDVVIPSAPANQPVLSTTAVAKSVEVQSGASLSISSAGSLTITDSRRFQTFIASFWNKGGVVSGGQLIINNTTGSLGYGLVNSGNFDNVAGGQIRIDGANSIGLYTIGGSFVNSSTITIGNASQYGVFNMNANFSNSGCSALLSIVSNAVINTFSGTFSNSGTIIENASGNSSISTNAGLVQNLNGGTFNIGTNTGVLTTTPGNQPTIVASPSLTITQGQSATLTASGAQTYSWSNGQSTSAISVSVAGPYSVTGTIGSCSSVTSVTLTVNAPVCGAGLSGPIWTGCVSRDWNTAGNWASGTVPAATDDVVIPSAPANQPVISTNAVAKSVEVQSGASLSITAAGNLTLNGSKSVGGSTTAFYNGGTVANSGQLVMGNTAAVGNQGIFNVATFINNAGGTISIDRSAAFGLRNNAGSFTNSGMVSIGAVASVGQYGLYNLSTFSNNAGGTISIDRATDYGLFNDGSTNTFTNSGTITIGAVASVGTDGINNQAIFSNTGCGGLIRIVSNSIVRSRGTFANGGTIIENASGNSSISDNTGLVQNLNGGTFTITGTNTGVLTTTPGPQPTIEASPSLTITQGQSATLTASGATGYNWSNGQSTSAISVSVAGPYSVTGTIGSCASVTTVTLTVNAPICGAGLSGPTWTGCVSTDWNTAGNWASGAVPTVTDDVVIPSGPTNQPILGTTATAKSVEVQTGASLSISSAGRLTINSFATLGGFPGAFYNQGTVNNNGTLMLGNTAPVGLIGLHNTGTFTNTGTLQVDRATNQGINNRDRATFTNTGNIIIGASVPMGTQGIWNQATFTHTGGTITIDRITGDGLLNSGNFVNSATITIGASASVTGNGLTNNPGASFTNATGGTITIDRTGVYGLANTFTATFINNSIITIGSLGTIENYGIVNPGLFTNSACATLTLLAPIFNNSNSFTNAGLLTVNTTRTHIDNGTLTNNGIIDYPQGNPIPNVTNNDVIAAPVSSCSSTINPALQLGGNSNQFTVATTWYKDQALTQPAGTYNQTSNTFTATNLAPGSSTTLYFATTDNANGCTKTVSVSVTINSVLTVSITASPSLTVCQGASVTLTASGAAGDPGTSYRWNNGQTTNFIIIDTNGPSGNPGSGGGYSGPGGPQSVTVTNATGCSASATVTLTISPIPVASISPSNLTVCQGQPASLTASGGSGYLWNTGQTTAIISVTATGTYSVTVSGETGPVGATGVSGGRRTAGEGCFATATSTVTVNSLPANASLSSGTLSCANTSVTLTATATGASSYTLSNGQPGSRTVNNTGQFVVNQPGAYTVTIANASGCTAMASTSVSSSTAAPVATLVSSGSLNCAVSSVTLTASPSGLSYTFSGPGVVSQGGNMAVVNAAGTYSVTVLSGNGCSGVVSTSVSSNTAAPSASLVSSGSLSCSVTSVTLTASPGGQSYRFSAGATQLGSSNQAVASASGQYSVTVISSNGCSAVASVSVSQDNSSPTASLVSSGSLSCSVTSVTLTANAGAGLTYQFSGPGIVSQSGNTALVNASGTYSVTVLSGNGCKAVASTGVSQDNTAPTATLASSGSLTCSVTSVTLTASGGSSYTFSSPGGAVLPGSGNTRVVSSPGTYSVVVANANSCTSGASVSVSQDNTATTATLVSSGSLSCAVSSVTLTASPGGNSYTFSGLGVVSQSGNMAVVNAAGTYSVTVVSANGCSSVASTSVSQDTTTPTASLVSSGSLTCSVTSVTLTASGGTSYTFSGPSGTVLPGSGNTRVVSSPGIYSVVVANASGCASIASTSVSQDNTVPTASLVSNGSLSCSVTSVTLTASPGGQAYTFSGPGILSQSGNIAVVNVSGQYSVTVTSGNGCSGVASTSVSQDNTSPSVSIGANPSLTITQGQRTVLTASASGASMPLAFSWSTLETTSAISVSTGGGYSVTVTSANGCSATASVVVSVTAAPVVSGPFAITGVSLVSCTPINEFRKVVGINPLYRGLDGSPVSFSVVGELRATTDAGPYTLQLYIDNPVITLIAVQAGVRTSFAYNWLSACQSGVVSPPPGDNTPPRIVSVVGNQNATVGEYFALSLAGVFTDTETPNSLVIRASGLPAGLNLTGTTLSGTPSVTGISTVTITATDPGSLSAGTSFVLTVSGVGSVTSTGPFAITSVTTLSCTPIVAGRIDISFTPRYAGLDGNTINFSVANELAATTNPGPYSLQLYIDNPAITLRAVQSGVVSSYVYNWLAACQSGVTPPPVPGNTAPRVVNGVGPQSATVGVGYTLSLASVFTDAETPNSLVLSANSLPAGLNLVGSTISGTPSLSGTSTVIITATDPGSLSVSTSFVLTVSPVSSQTTTPPVDPPVPTAVFSITGVQTLSCAAVSEGLRTVTFTPQYAGLNGQPITFSVVNELAATTSPGPYSLNLYTDNPVINLRASQAGSGGEVSFAYNWLSVCGAGSRLRAEGVESLRVTVLGNPVLDELVEIEVLGAGGQSLQVDVVNGRGRKVSETYRKQAYSLERLELRVGPEAGLYLLRVSIPGQSQTVKLLKL